VVDVLLLFYDVALIDYAAAGAGGDVTVTLKLKVTLIFPSLRTTAI
jgi:hypothetical protein